MQVRTLITFILIVLSNFLNSQNKEWVKNIDSIFSFTTSTHFNLYSIEGHISDETKKKVLQERELAYKKLSAFFETEFDVRINIFLFQNEQLKYSTTGHKGYGWAFDNTIVEVYNDSIKVDPYHETVHILGYKITKPPAIIDEGTCVYLSHLFGDKPFSKLLGYHTKSINEILLMFNENEKTIPLAILFSYDKIEEAKNPVFAYCQSASFVRFLITHFGKGKFLKFFKSVSISDKSDYENTFAKIYGKDFNEIEIKWKDSLGLK